MESPYTQEQIEEIVLAFEGTHGKGLIDEIVFSEQKKEALSVIDPKSLEKFFSDLGWSGIAEMIHFIAEAPKEKSIAEIGSHCIDFYGITKGPFSFQNARLFVGITIGSKKKGISPLEWLTYLARGFDRLSKLQKSGFNDFCKDIAKIEAQIASGSGVRSFTAEEFF